MSNKIVENKKNWKRTALDLKTELEQEKIKRVNSCKNEIEETLKRNNCFINVGMLLTAQGNMPQVNIVAKE